MEKTKTQKEIIRSVADGQTYTLPLNTVSYHSFFQRAYELNKEDGWRHYDIRKSKANNTLTIIAHNR